MKAIKLASIFAVSAVAAAVSTTTFAADPVFSGAAGLYHYAYDGETNSYTSDGELNIIIDTGVVYLDMDMDSNVDDADDNTYGVLVLDEAYVTQGAVKFGDFDGSLTDAAVTYGGVEEGNDYSDDLDATLGVRYSVSDDLTVAFEATDDSADDGFGLSYEADLGVATLYVSAGIQGEGSAVAVGFEMPLGSATLAGYAQSGTDTAEADMGSMGLGVDFALSDALSLSAAYLEDSEDDDDSNTEVSAYYTAGDIEYLASYVDYSTDSGDADYLMVGARTSF